MSALCCHRAADHALDGGDDLQQQDVMHQPGTGCCKHCNEIIVHAILNGTQSSTMPTQRCCFIDVILKGFLRVGGSKKEAGASLDGNANSTDCKIHPNP